MGFRKNKSDYPYTSEKVVGDRYMIPQACHNPLKNQRRLRHGETQNSPSKGFEFVQIPRVVRY